MRDINEIIVHCTATPAGREVTVDELRHWHMDPKPKGRGWSDIGYHYLVHMDGSVSPCRPIERVGAHVSGHNTGTIGVCYVGGVSANDVKIAEDTRTPTQKDALIELLKGLVSKYQITKISGHHDYANKACPSFPAAREYAYLLEKPSAPAPPQPPAPAPKPPPPYKPNLVERATDRDPVLKGMIDDVRQRSGATHVVLIF